MDAVQNVEVQSSGANVKSILLRLVKTRDLRTGVSNGDGVSGRIAPISTPSVSRRMRRRQFVQRQWGWSVCGGRRRRFF